MNYSYKQTGIAFNNCFWTLYSRTPFLTQVYCICVQFCRHLILSEKGHIDWKLMYFALQKCYPVKEQYGDTLHFCRHCSILFWKVRCFKKRALQVRKCPTVNCGKSCLEVKREVLLYKLVPLHILTRPVTGSKL